MALALLGWSASVSVGHLPLTAFAAVDLGGAQRVRARNAIHRGRCAFEGHGVRDIAEDLGFDELDLVGGAVREALGEDREELVEFLLPADVCPGAKDRDRIAA